MSDLVLYPHCDIHVALHATPQLKLTVFSRDLSATRVEYVLTDVTNTCAYDFFAPYNPVGSRFQSFVSIDATGKVTPTAVGTNLVQIRTTSQYIVARIQVHDHILGWWFGNSSITTAKDTIGHSQPSIYALFSDDAAGSRLVVGDITGHGYVGLTSGGSAVFTVDSRGRLRGVAEGTEQLRGTFLATTKQLPVRVVDYSRTRDELDGVQVPDINGAAEMHNILFLTEGFRDTPGDRQKFDEIVAKAVEDLFSKPRHSPYNLLEGSFNIWKIYEPSVQHTLTTGYRVNDEDAGNLLPKGLPIPFEGAVTEKKDIYSPQLLVRRVGLPQGNETGDTTQLKGLWGSQNLSDFDPAKVDDEGALVTAWKGQKSVGILEARDTVFGLHLGRRFADRVSGTSPVARPANEAASDALKAFIARVYEWFDLNTASRHISPDPRRHPPELLRGDDLAPRSSLLTYLGSLRWRFPPHQSVGLEWVPDPAGAFKRSVGLIALLVNDGLEGGTNFGVATANTLASFQSLSFEYTNSPTERVLRRTPPPEINAEIDNVISIVAHEFGHTFNLKDEYEDFPGDDPSADVPTDFGGDNVSRLGAIYEHGTMQGGKIKFTDNQIDPAKVKWFELLRPQISARLIRDSEVAGSSIKVTIDRRFIGEWVEAKRRGLQAFLRKPDIDISASAQQLPLSHADAHYRERLPIGDIDEARGTIQLQMPTPPPFPTFPKGSFLFVPRRDSANALEYVVEKKVIERLSLTHLVLNANTDSVHVNKEADSPVDIAGFKPPCKSYKLIGIYEGAVKYAGRNYRPAGQCKMRDQFDSSTGSGEFCHVCKYLIVNRINPGLHALLDKTKYPGAKKRG